MSLTRSFFNDFNPLFRLVEDPESSYYSTPARKPTHHQRQAVVEVSEEGKEYIVRAELPGVAKEDLDIHVGNDGRSLTIEGHVHRSNKSRSTAQTPQTPTPAQDTPSQAKDSPQIPVQGQPGQPGQSGQPEQTETYEYHSTFSRTVWLPHAVDGKNARAQLTDGVLTLNIPKRDESGRQKISLM